jgi:hypothetical protein
MSDLGAHLRHAAFRPLPPQFDKAGVAVKLAAMHSRLSGMGWWPRLLRLAAAGLLAFYVHYLPWHLTQECHLPAGFPLASASADEDCGHELACCPHAEDHHGDAHHHDHVPHPAAEHELQMLGKSGKSFALGDFVSPACEILSSRPQAGLMCALTETFLRPPPAPDPTAQPRGPPVV